MPFFERGYAGGQGWETLGTPPGGGSFYDVAGKIDVGSFDPFRGPEQFESEYTGKSGWEDVWKSLAITGGNAIIARTLYTPKDRGSGNKQEYLKGVVPINPKSKIDDKFLSSLNPYSSVFSSGKAGIGIAIIAIAIMILVFISRR